MILKRSVQMMSGKFMFILCAVDPSEYGQAHMSRYVQSMQCTSEPLRSAKFCIYAFFFCNYAY